MLLQLKQHDKMYLGALLANGGTLDQKQVLGLVRLSKGHICSNTRRS